MGGSARDQGKQPTRHLVELSKLRGNILSNAGGVPVCEDSGFLWVVVVRAC